VLSRLVFALLLLVAPFQAATLERLSLDEMSSQATSIVRGRILGSFGQFVGPVVYTHYKVQVTERYKGTTANALTVLLPGGSANGVQHDVAGAPQLNNGEEYVLFLWTGKSGITHIIGLSQGVFSLPQGETDPVAVRNASTEMMIDPATGLAVKDQRLTIRLSDLKSRISSALAKGTTK
jgi:hypothetical protein